MGLESDLRLMLGEAGRPDLAREALGRVAITDDGAAYYIHVLPQATWRRLAPGRAYVLAWADHEAVGSLADCKEFVREGRRALRDRLEDIIRWLDRR